MRSVGGVVAGFEAPAFVAGLDDVAVVGKAVEERGGHLGIPEDARPFAEREVRGDDDRGALIEAADEVEEQLPTGLCEGKVAELVEDQEVEAAEEIGGAALAVGSGFGVELVDQVHDVEEPAAGAVAEAGPSDRDGKVRLPRSGAPDQHHVALLLEEGAAGQIAYQRLVDRRLVEVELVDLLGQRQPGDGHLVLDRAGLLLADLRGEQVTDDLLRLVLALDRGGDDLVVGRLHAVELQLAHRVQHLRSFHGRVS